MCQTTLKRKIIQTSFITIQDDLLIQCKVLKSHIYFWQLTFIWSTYLFTWAYFLWVPKMLYFTQSIFHINFTLFVSDSVKQHFSLMEQTLVCWIVFCLQIKYLKFDRYTVTTCITWLTCFDTQRPKRTTIVEDAYCCWPTAIFMINSFLM